MESRDAGLGDATALSERLPLPDKPSIAVLPFTEVGHWSLTTLREKLIKLGTKVVRHSRYVTFQLAEVAIPQHLFAAVP